MDMHDVERVDCVGHVQKRMGTALRELKKQYRGQKPLDGTTTGGAGRVTESAIHSLQNYYYAVTLFEDTQAIFQE